MSYIDFKKKLDRLKSDNGHGASYIEKSIFKIFIKAARELKISDFRRLVDYSSNWPAVMANILNLIDNIQKYIQHPENDIVSFLRLLQADILTDRDKICSKAASIIKRCKSIVTISASGLVYESIKRAIDNGWRGAVIIAESRPVLEGKSLAVSLAKFPIRVVYGTDCQVFSMLDDVNAAFIGADLISKRYFINKTGTNALLSCLGLKKKAYILADSSKYYAFPDKIIIPEMPPHEVWSHHPDKVKIVNRYFEKIYFQKNLVFVDESGSIHPDKIKKYLEKRQFSN